MPHTMVTPGASLDIPPRYTRDPETISIRSSAPSYVSDAPTYTSSAPHQRHTRTHSAPTGLPPPTSAPGFPCPSSNKLDALNFAISTWVPVTSGHQARHYQNVAARRATLAVVEEEVRLSALARNRILLSPSSPTSSSSYSSSPVAETPVTVSSTCGSEPETPHSPHEDPDLVGTEAATIARERRLYLQRCAEEQEALRQESKSWDFMLAQMADWAERERSWDAWRKGVRKGVRGGNLLGRRFR